MDKSGRSAGGKSGYKVQSQSALVHGHTCSESLTDEYKGKWESFQYFSGPLSTFSHIDTKTGASP